MKKVSMTGAERQRVAGMPSANRKKYYQDMMMREANTNPTKTIADYKTERAAELKEQKRLGTREEQRAKKEASAKAAGFGSFKEQYLAKQAARKPALATEPTPPGGMKKGGMAKMKKDEMPSKMGKVKTSPKADGVATKGKTKGKMVKMAAGGMKGYKKGGMSCK